MPAGSASAGPSDDHDHNVPGDDADGPTQLSETLRLHSAWQNKHITQQRSKDKHIVIPPGAAAQAQHTAECIKVYLLAKSTRQSSAGKALNSVYQAQHLMIVSQRGGSEQVYYTTAYSKAIRAA